MLCLLLLHMLLDSNYHGSDWATFMLPSEFHTGLFFVFFRLISIYVREFKALVPEVSRKSVFPMHAPVTFFPFSLASFLFLSSCELMELMLA